MIKIIDAPFFDLRVEKDHDGVGLWAKQKKQDWCPECDTFYYLTKDNTRALIKELQRALE